MRKEIKKLEDKIKAFDEYCSQHLDPNEPEAFYGADTESEERKQIDKWAKELMDLANKANPFSNSSPEEVEIRNKALVQLQVIKLAQNASNAQMNPNAKIPTDPHLRSAYDQQKKKEAETMAKFTLALNAYERGGKELSTTVDVDYITWVNSTSPADLRKALDTKLMENVANNPKMSYEVKKNACIQFSSYAQLMPAKDGKGYSLDYAKMSKDGLTELFKNSQISSMIKNYKKAEAKWVTSSIPESTEIRYRIGFMNTYKEELKAVNAAIKMMKLDNPEVAQAVDDALENAGIKELMKNYRFSMEPKSIDENFMVGGMNSFEADFLKAMGSEVQNNPANATKSKELMEFRKFLYDNCKDANRHVVDEFNSLSEKEQLRTMQYMENGGEIKAEDVDKEYTPDLKKIKANFCAPKWKFWKKAGGKNINWNYFKKSAEKASRDMQAEKAAAKESKSKAPLQGKLKPVKKELCNEDAYVEMDKEAKDLSKANIGIKVATNMLPKFGMTMLGTCAGYVGMATTTIETAINAKKLHVAKYREKQSKQLVEDIKDVKKEKLNENEKNIFKKIARNATIQKVINKFRTKQAKVDVATSAVSIVSQTACAAGATAIGMGLTAVTMGVSKGVTNKINKEAKKEIIDASLYENEVDRNKQLADTKKNLDRKYMRMSPKMQQKYKQYFDKNSMHTDYLKDVNRQEALRKSGQNTMDDLKNSVISDVRKETTQLVKEAKRVSSISAPLSEFEKKQLDLTEKLANSVGVDYDVTKMKYDDIIKKAKAPTKEKQMESKTNSKLVMA